MLRFQCETLTLFQGLFSLFCARSQGGDDDRRGRRSAGSGEHLCLAGGRRLAGALTASNTLHPVGVENGAATQPKVTVRRLHHCAWRRRSPSFICGLIDAAPVDTYLRLVAVILYTRQCWRRAIKQRAAGSRLSMRQEWKNRRP